MWLSWVVDGGGTDAKGKNGFRVNGRVCNDPRHWGRLVYLLLAAAPLRQSLYDERAESVQQRRHTPQTLPPIILRLQNGMLSVDT